MNLSGNTVLITGGATGIGFAMAEAFSAAGSEVIICGRREDQLTGGETANSRAPHQAMRRRRRSGPESLAEWATVSSRI